MKKIALFFISFVILVGFSSLQTSDTSIFRVFPYLQVYGAGEVQLSWMTGENTTSTVELYDDQGLLIFTQSISPELVSEIYYTSNERNQSIPGLGSATWLQQPNAYKYVVRFNDLEAGASYTYQVKVGGSTYGASFKTRPDKNNWDKIRIIALSDSETDPLGRVTRRAWYPANAGFRPSSSSSLWRDKFGTTTEQGLEILNYALTEEEGYRANLDIIDGRLPDLLLMPGDLVQGGGYQPAWDEFFRQNAGPAGNGLSTYPIIPALGNWENFGAFNGGYGTNEKGEFNPKVGRERFHAYFETPTTDPLQKHRQSYYRVDYGPVTVLTLDSSNGQPDDSRSNTPVGSKLKNLEYAGPGTDTQENFTHAQYQAAGGSDLSGFGPGSDQYSWLESNLIRAEEEGQLVFVQFHHIPFSSGEHGVPMNHELSTGQGGTPLRVLHPLFEEYGVIAVMAGHDELFERSFVDENGDGKGVHYYDVGVAGDGMRGEKRNWLRDPTQLLNYNSFRQWTADQNEPEQWDESGSVPQLRDGGKHYGHLEVNLERVSEGGDTFAKIRFSPVYVFPVLGQNYELQRVERRVYKDEVELRILLASTDFVPEFRDSLAIYLNEEGKATLSPEDFLKELPNEEFNYNSAVGFEFSCVNLGKNEFQIIAENVRTEESWVSDLKLVVLDTISPRIEMSVGFIDFDPLAGSKTLNAEDFALDVTFDNCNSTYTTSLSKTEMTCADISWRDPQKQFEVIGSVTDASGNRSNQVVTVLNARYVPSDTISLSARGPLFVGAAVELELGEEFEYEVLAWFRNEQLLEGFKGKNILIENGGNYFAEIELSTGCRVISKILKVNAEDVPFPPVKDEITLFLDQDGQATLSPEDIFTSWPAEEELNVVITPSAFGCEAIGDQEIDVVVSDLNGNSWDLPLSVLIQDDLPPILQIKNLEIALDRVAGTIELDVEDFIAEVKDNCDIKEVSLSRNTITCEDIGKELVLELRAVDLSGNVTEETAILNVLGTVSAPVTLVGESQICQGQSTLITAASAADFEVVQWRRNGQAIGSNGKSIEVNQAGQYEALIRFQGGCLWESTYLEVLVSELPEGEIERNGFTLIAPEGDFDYQWLQNNDPLEEQVSRELLVTEPGSYTVILTNSSGCERTLNAVEFSQEDFDNPFPPVKEEIILELDSETGEVTLLPEDAFTSWPPTDPDLEITFSQSDFSCEDLAEPKEVVVRIEDEGGRVWERLTLVVVKDTSPPNLILRDLEVEFDLVSGEVRLTAEDFIEEISDNCEVLEVTLNQSVYTCEDLDREIEVEILARDVSGNTTVKVAKLGLNAVSSAPVTIGGALEFCAGAETELTLNSDAEFEVIRWRRNGQEIPGARGKTLLTGEPGDYHSVVRYANACVTETEKVTVSEQAFPTGEIKEEGSTLVAPEGDFSYQWYRDDAVLVGETNRIIQLDEMGTYTVDLTSSAGCIANLGPVEVTISGIFSRPVVQPESLKIFPNPAESLVEVTIESDPSFSLVSMQIYTQEGRDITSSVRIAQKSNVDFELNLELLPQGMYLIWIRGEGQKLYFGKLVKQ